MFPLLLFATSLYADPSPLAVPIDLDTIKVEDAVPLERRLSKSKFTITSPPDTRSNLTVVGTGWYTVERSAFQRKDLLMEKGDEVTVVGVLTVIHYPPSLVNRTFIPPWTEVRVSPMWRVKAKELTARFQAARLSPSPKKSLS